MNDQAGQPPGEPPGERLDHVTVPVPQHVQAAVQVNRREPRVRRHVREHAVKLLRRVGVQLSRQALLPEAQGGQLQQRVIAGVALQEQGVDGRQPGGIVGGRPVRGQGLLRPWRRAVRFSALMTPRSEACTIDSLTPTPHSTCRPTSISR